MNPPPGEPPMVRQVSSPPPASAGAARPLAVTIASALLWLCSAAIVAGGVAIVAWTFTIEHPDPWSTIMPFISEMLAFLVVAYGVLTVALGVLIAGFTAAAFRGAAWSRWVLAGLVVVTLLAGLGFLTPSSPAQGVLLGTGAVLLLTPVVLLFLPRSTAWLRQRPGPGLRPH